jgi:hypothetical protein
MYRGKPRGEAQQPRRVPGAITRIALELTTEGRQSNPESGAGRSR